ncbi:MAG: hypothetical protein JXB48_06950 [Candidatus Latescibacteria bacterium]|nr:hypothetical protein [Candidatus Latescibacterota bacterium]
MYFLIIHLMLVSVFYTLYSHRVAAEETKVKDTEPRIQSQSFIDENGDGICDFYLWSGSSQKSVQNKSTNSNNVAENTMSEKTGVNDGKIIRTDRGKQTVKKNDTFIEPEVVKNNTKNRINRKEKMHK